MNKYKVSLSLVLGTILISGIACSSGTSQPTATPTKTTTTTPTPDLNTVLFDHFDDATTAQYVNGTMSYVDGPSGFGRAADFMAGNWARYNVSGWYQWTSEYNPTGKQGTVELWMYPNQYDIGFIDFNWNNPTSYPSAGHILNMGINAQGNLTASTWTAISGTPLTGLSAGNTTIPLNQWTHVAFTWGDAGTKLYVNGVLDASTPDNLYPALNPTFYVHVPNWGKAGLGYIDELHILDTQVDYTPVAAGGGIGTGGIVGIVAAIVIWILAIIAAVIWRSKSRRITE